MSDIDTGIEGCIVVITGDIAYSGQVNQYNHAEQFLNDLKSCLIKTVGVSEIHFVLVPGNHDCDFSTPNQVRDILISTLAKGGVETVSNELATQSLAVQANYWQFASRITGNAVKNPPNDQLCHIEQIKVGGKTISFNAYNTAWMSQLHDLQGGLHFPYKVIPDEDATSDLVVSLFHHPYNWLESVNARAFRTSIERNSDLILTGHEHEFDQYVKTNRVSGETNEYIEGAVLRVRQALALKNLEKMVMGTVIH
jgi:predicted MPP superfamily phosphohydrolase